MLSWTQQGILRPVQARCTSSDSTLQRVPVIIMRPLFPASDHGRPRWITGTTAAFQVSRRHSRRRLTLCSLQVSAAKVSARGLIKVWCIPSGHHTCGGSGSLDENKPRLLLSAGRLCLVARAEYLTLYARPHPLYVQC